MPGEGRRVIQNEGVTRTGKGRKKTKKELQCRPLQVSFASKKTLYCLSQNRRGGGQEGKLQGAYKQDYFFKQRQLWKEKVGGEELRRGGDEEKKNTRESSLVRTFSTREGNAKNEGSETKKEKKKKTSRHNITQRKRKPKDESKERNQGLQVSGEQHKA